MKRFLVLIVFMVSLSSSIGEECALKSPCVCLEDNGSGVDLNGLDSYLTATLGNISFYYNPCKDGKLPSPPAASDNECNKEGYSLCAHDSVNNTYKLLGLSKDITFASTPESVHITYKNKYFIELRCSAKSNNNPDVLYALSETNFVLFSPASCYNHIEPSHHGFIYSMFIICIVFLFLYIIGGVLFRYFYIGARGLEVVPNLSFWKNTYWKLKQGSIYVMNGCKVTEANYDAI